MTNLFKILLIVVLLLGTCGAYAQTPTALCTTVAGNPFTSCVPVSTTAPLPIAVYGGTTGQCYTSNGAATAATFQACGGGGGGSISIGTSTITGGTNTRVLYDNSGVVGEYVISGTGNVCMTTSCTMVTPALGIPSAVVLTNATGMPWSGVISTPTTLAGYGITSPLPVAQGGTAASSASITAFNNITGYTASGATGTTSTNVVFSTSPTIATPTFSGNITTGITGSTQCLQVNSSGVIAGSGAGCGGAGVTSFTGDGTLLSNSGSTGAVTATLATAVANSVWGNNTGSVAAPGYQTAINVAGSITGAAGSFTTLAASSTMTGTSSSANALDVGPNGATTPVLQVDASTGSAVAGLKVKGAATGGTVAVSAIDSGSNTNLTVDAKGSGTIGVGTVSTGAITLGANTGVTGTLTGTSASASALAIGLTGATNSAFNVDASTASQVAGLNVKGAATGGTVAVSTIDSGSNNNLTINAKGTGTIGVGTISTGAITLGANTTVTGHVTLEGVTSTGATGTAKLVFSASPTFTGTVTGAAETLTGTLTTNVTGSTQCLHVNTSGVVSGTGSDCGAGGSVSITAADTSIVVSPSPITGTGTVAVSSFIQASAAAFAMANLGGL